MARHGYTGGKQEGELFGGYALEGRGVEAGSEQGRGEDAEDERFQRYREFDCLTFDGFIVVL